MILLDEQRKQCIAKAISHRYSSDKAKKERDHTFTPSSTSKGGRLARKAILDQVANGNELDLYHEQWTALLLDLKRHLKVRPNVILINLVNDVKAEI